MHSVRIISIDEKTVRDALGKYVAQLKQRQGVRAVYLCGSWAKGNYSPGSDIDLLIVVEKEEGLPHERVPRYLPDSFPLGLDLFIYTVAEIEKSRFARELLRDAVEI